MGKWGGTEKQKEKEREKKRSKETEGEREISSGSDCGDRGSDSF